MTDSSSEHTSSEVIETAEALQQKSIDLVRATRRTLVMFTPDMEAETYNNDAFSSAVLEILKRSKHTEIRILTLDSKAAIEQEHRLLRLFRYSDRQLQIRKLGIEREFKCASYLIGDDCRMLRRLSMSQYRSFFFADDRARVKTQLDEFEQFWRLSARDPLLDTITL